MIIPTISEKNFEEVNLKIKKVDSEAPLIQIDIADNKLVTGETFKDIALLDNVETNSKFELDLMVEDPLTFLDKKLIKVERILANVNGQNIKEFIQKAKDLGYITGVSISPDTDLKKLFEFVNSIDYVQFTTVTPGGQGRDFHYEMLDKIIEFKNKRKTIPIQVDGGVNHETLKLMNNLGINNFVIGSAIVKSENPVEEIKKFRSQLATVNEVFTISARVKKVGILGGAGWEEKEEPYIDAYNVSKLLAENGYEIVNGGGPGVMRASTKGAHAGGGKVLAITYHPNKPKKNYEGIDPENDFDEEVLTLDYFDRTKVLLQNTDLHIVFKGSSGTISEFGMTWASSRIHEGNSKPIILFGSFWHEIIQCLEKTMFLRPGEKELLKICTKPEEVLEYIKSYDK